MGLNFRKSISLGKGVKLNLSKSGPSVSFGRSGMRQSVSLNGKTRTTVGIPGTGVYYTKTSSVGNILGGITGKGKDNGKGKKATSQSAKTTAAAQKKADAAAAKAAEKEQKAKELEAEIAENKTKVEEYEAYIESIKSVHKASDGEIDWVKVKGGTVPADMIELKNYADRILEGDIDAYLEVIGAFEPFEDLIDYGSDFMVGTDDPTILEVEFGVKSEDVVPSESLSLTSTGKLSQKEMGKQAYYDLVQDYVCSTILRVARDSFALLPIERVLIHAVDKVLNPATGFDDEVTLVSVMITREQIKSINMERVDPSDALTNFECKMNFKKTTGFAPVDRVLP